jgi:cytoskeletal protein CcmA (bactofilin family)
MNGDHTGTMTFSSGLTIDANIQVNGSVTATEEITAKSSHTVSAHTHTQGNDSHGDTEAATNAPTG